jgi:glycosyltransferase involved in cell wall biosynthesis
MNTNSTINPTLYSNENEIRNAEINLPEILFITSIPPRECGIATYSQDLANALHTQFGNSFKTSICSLESATERHTYYPKPKMILNIDQVNAFEKTAFLINRDQHISLVVIQHEFGFFVSKEEKFKIFIDTITKPIAFVFHTVLPRPNDALKALVQKKAKIAASIIVMTKDAADILKNDYNIAADKIAVIPHGTHLVPPLERTKLKEHYQLSGRKILSTFGLLGSSKSIETTLNALPAIVKIYPEVLFLVLGKTHPSLVKQEGETYRTMLEEKVIDLKIEKNVQFVNEYLPLPKLLEYLQLSDIYLFTSKDPNQAVSGTFSYAMSSGCPVISTPIPQAKELLGQDNGLIIDFENSNQLSEAVILLLNDVKLRAEMASKSYQKMASTAWQNSAIAHALLFQKLTNSSIELKYRIPSTNINHIQKMTTDFGIIQFSKIAIPDMHSGYTLDDNARALIAICQHYELNQNPKDLQLIERYIQFIAYCLQPDGRFLNYVNEQKEFTSQNYYENLEDSNGRALWALGYVISLKEIMPVHFSIEAENVFQQAIPHLDKIHSTRSMAFIIKGLYYQNRTENMALLKTIANKLVQMYRHEKSINWDWFESYLTYGNSVIPEAMLCAYSRTQDLEYKKIAIESFDFLISKIFIAGELKVISNKGWLVKGEKVETVIGGEQPIDVAYTVVALEKFYFYFKKEEYKEKAIIAFNWFLGANHLRQIIYNPCTGGCYDGLEEHNVNLNQGAESTVSYLLGRLSIERLMSQEHKASVVLKSKNKNEYNPILGPMLSA